MPLEKPDHVDKKKAAEPQTDNGLFADAYKAVDKIKDAGNATVEFVQEHPVGVTVGAGAIIGAVLLLKGKPLYGGAAAELKAGQSVFARIGSESAPIIQAAENAGDNAVIAAARKSGTTLEVPALQRKTVDGAVIPDVVRPQLEKGLSLTTPEALAATGKKYESGLVELFKLPREAVGEAGQTIDDFALGSLKSRAGTTGERVTEFAAKGESERLLSINPHAAGLSDLGGVKMTVLDEAQLVKLASGDVQFKFTPQLGQFLKATGKITEEHIGEAMAVQKAGSKKMLGEILVDLKHAEQADVDLAFSSQNIVKATLKEVRENFLKTVK